MITFISTSCRGGKIGPTRWASLVRPELGPGWAIKLLARKNRVKFGPAQYGLARPDPSEIFLPSKGYLARPARFLGRAGQLKFWPKKTGPILARPGFGPARPARLPALASCKQSSRHTPEVLISSPLPI